MSRPKKPRASRGEKRLKLLQGGAPAAVAPPPEDDTFTVSASTPLVKEYMRRVGDFNEKRQWKRCVFERLIDPVLLATPRPERDKLIVRAWNIAEQITTFAMTREATETKLVQAELALLNKKIADEGAATCSCGAEHPEDL